MPRLPRIAVFCAALLFATAVSLLAAQTLAAQGPPDIQYTLPKPTYPRVAMAAGIDGTGVVQVTFGKDGKVAASHMVRSTGSIILDRLTLKFVRENWRSSGGRKVTREITLEFRMPPPEKPGAPPASSSTTLPLEGYYPKPNYPMEARFSHVSGVLQLRMTVAASGRVRHVEIVHPSGSDLLDGYTADFVRLNWRFPAGQPCIHTTNFNYFLR